MAIIERNGNFRVQVGKRINGKYTILFDATYDSEEEAIAVQGVKKLELKEGELGDYRSAKKMTLSDLLLRYKKEVVPHVTNYPNRENSKIEGLRKRKFAKITVAKLKPIHFSQYRDERRLEKGRGSGLIKKKTIKEELALIARVLNYAAAEWEVSLPAGNPVNIRTLLTLLPNDSIKRKPLPRDDNGKSFSFERELIKACAAYGDGELAMYLRFSIETSCRRGALVGLQWENISIDKRIAVVKQKGRSKDETYKVPLTRRAIATLNRLGVKKTGKVFSWTHPDSINMALNRACERAGIEKITPHQFRHEATTRAQAKRWTSAEVKALTGHKTTQMLDNYGHLGAEDILRLMEKIK